MYKLEIKKEIIQRIFEYFLIIILILQFNTVWSTFYTYDFAFSNTLLCLDIIFAFIYFVIYNKGKKNIGIYIKYVFFIFLYFVTYYIFSFFNSPQIIQYLRFLITFLSIFTIWFFGFKGQGFTRIKLFLKRFSNVILILGIISFILWILISTLQLISTNQVFESTWGAVNNINAIFYGWNNVYFTKGIEYVFSNHLVRNIGIFAEAPMFSFLLCLSLVIELFINNFSIKNNIKITFLSLIIFSTFSSTGIIILVSSIVIRLLMNKHGLVSSIAKIIFPIIFFIVFVLFIYVFEQKINSSSGITRLDDFNVGFLAWKDSFLFGHGYMNNENIQKYFSLVRINNLGLSNSFSPIVAYGGLFLLIPYLFVFYKSYSYALQGKNWNQFMFITIVLVMLVVTNVPFKSITYLILLIFSDKSFYSDDHYSLEVTM